MKSCAKCRAKKPDFDFYSDRSRTDGLSSRCKTCILDDRAEYREANREKLKLGARADRRRVPERGCWQAMIDRCYDEKNDSFSNYGGRGIRVCERWRASFANFLADMGSRPSLAHTVDRKDPDGDYEPANCRWATPKEQGRNTRTNRLLTMAGKTQCIAAWGDDTGIPASVISDRLQLGWSDEKALTTQVAQMRTGGLTARGETLSVNQWARRVGLSRATIDERLAVGWDVERAIFTPSQRGKPRAGFRARRAS